MATKSFSGQPSRIELLRLFVYQRKAMLQISAKPRYVRHGLLYELQIRLRGITLCLFNAPHHLSYVLVTCDGSHKGQFSRVSCQTVSVELPEYRATLILNGGEQRSPQLGFRTEQGKAKTRKAR